MNAGIKTVAARNGRFTFIPILVVNATIAVAVIHASPGQVPPPFSRFRSADTPKWEVVSIKPCKPGERGAVAAGDRGSGTGLKEHHGILSLGCLSLKNFISMAYFTYANGQHNLSPFIPISGGPDWFGTATYHIDAKAEGDPRLELMWGPMLQTLLEDRFKLKLHLETREVPVFELTVAKGGPKNLQKSKDGECRPLLESTNPLPPDQMKLPICGYGGGRQIGPNRTLNFTAITLDGLSIWLRDLLGRPVIDRTGIGEAFDIHLEFAPDDATPGQPSPPERPGEQELHAKDPAAPNFFTALEEHLGLKLVPAKGPGEFLVIDSAERPLPN